MAWCVKLFIAYLLGSIPFGYLVGKWVKGIDIRQHGSRSIGTTNVVRVLGKRWGILVLCLDIFKGYLAVQNTRWWDTPPPIPLLLSFGVAAILGHSFPIWLRFRGGKGVATSLGVFLALIWLPTLLAFGVWCLVFAATRIVSIASLIAAISFPVLTVLIYHDRPEFNLFLVVGLFLLAFIAYTHRANIQRLMRGEEKQLF